MKQAVPVQAGAELVQLELRLLLELQPLQMLRLCTVPAVDVPVRPARQRQRRNGCIQRGSAPSEAAPRIRGGNVAMPASRPKLARRPAAAAHLAEDGAAAHLGPDGPLRLSAGRRCDAPLRRLGTGGSQQENEEGGSGGGAHAFP